MQKNLKLCYQNRVRIINLNTVDTKSSENLTKFRYLGTVATYRNNSFDESKLRVINVSLVLNKALCHYEYGGLQ
jgi:hypothetical protein